MASLHEIAPRLARARDQVLVERARESRADLALRRKRLRLEQLVAHRELQLIRAYGHRNDRYIAQRQRKLAAAQRALQELKSL